MKAQFTIADVIVKKSPGRGNSQRLVFLDDRESVDLNSIVGANIVGAAHGENGEVVIRLRIESKNGNA